MDEFIDSCKFNDGTDCDLEHALHIRNPPILEENIESCWTINSVIGRPEMEPRRSPTSVEQFLIVKPHVEEYPEHVKAGAVYISLHNARQIKNPFRYGFPMAPETLTRIRLKKVVKKLLPPPYETNCIDYIEEWKSRGGHGPTTQRECFQECERNISLQDYGCVPHSFEITGNVKLCNYAELTDMGPQLAKIDECQKEHCYPACFEENFEVEREIIEQSVQYHDCPRGPVENQQVRILITRSGMETTTYTHNAKFEEVEVFSNIGGYIGIWLGISLIAVFDFLETVLLIMSYPFKSYKKTKKRNKRRDDHKNFRRDL